jgi:AcrR family transcriptional regulator
MVEQGSPDDVNVKAISELAGIHRKTFYLHYTCIEALYEDVAASVAREYAAEVAKLPVPYDYRDLTRVFIDFYTRDVFTEKLACDPRWSDFAQTVSARSLASNREGFNPFRGLPAEEQKLINAFASGASNVVLRTWIAGGKQVSTERVAELLGGLLEDGVASIRSA